MEPKRLTCAVECRASEDGPMLHGVILTEGRAASSPWQKAPLHSTGDASRLTALFLGRIWPICSLVTPCQPGASPVSVRRGGFTTGC